MDLQKTVTNIETVFNFDYDMDWDELLGLYEKAKKRQWNASEAIDWDRPVDLERGILEDERIAVYGTPLWDRLGSKKQNELNCLNSAWILSQFMHGEQGALITCGQIVSSIPWLEGKLYTASQVMDEGRHVEVYTKYLQLKLGRIYPVNQELNQLMKMVLTDSRWYFKLIGMQLIIESLALASFKSMARNSKDDLIKDIIKYVMADESRHVGFGVLALRDLITNEIPEAEREELADFAYEACGLMAKGFFPAEVYAEVGFTEADIPEIRETVRNAPARREFLSGLWSVLVPNLKKVGLITDRMRPRYEEVRLLQYEDLPVMDNEEFPGATS